MSAASFRKKEAKFILALIAAGSNGIDRNLIKLNPQTFFSMKGRKLVLQIGDKVEIHPKLVAKIAKEKAKEAEKEARAKEFSAIKKRLDNADCLVHVSRYKSGVISVSLLTDTGRRYKATAAHLLDAARDAFEAKDRHESLKEEMNLWKNF